MSRSTNVTCGTATVSVPSCHRRFSLKRSHRLVLLILAKPENREKLIFFMGIERVRYRHPVHPGDTVEIEAVVKRLRSRMGVLSGAARVNGAVVCDGRMTFALGPKTGSIETPDTSA